MCLFVRKGSKVADMHPGTGMPAQLVRYWTAGAGGAKIAWGTDGDYNRCIANIQAEVGKDGAPLPDRVVHGLCATLHKIATGATPGHAAGEGG
jgi:hypothetical protein